jgi:hypothetical protein
MKAAPGGAPDVLTVETVQTPNPVEDKALVD